MEYIDLILANIEYNFGSIGSFCVGNNYVCQPAYGQLTASSYVFTTSQPLLLTAGTLNALEMLENNPKLTQQLQKKSLLLHKSLSQLKVIKKYSLEVIFKVPMNFTYKGCDPLIHESFIQG